MADSKTVVQLAAGEAHTLALTAAGSVYAWGRGMFARLGTGNETDECTPVHILPLPESGAEESSEMQEQAAVQRKGGRERMVGVATGAYHSLSLADDGTIWSWGYNAYGQLGREGPTSKPCPVEVLRRDMVSTNDAPGHNYSTDERKPDTSVVKAVAVEAGGMMSCAIDEDGCLWLWGSCPLSPDPDANEQFSCSVFEHPEPVRGLGYGAQVIKVACGNEHILALVRPTAGASDACYAWGNNKHGQLGLGHKISSSRPQVVAGLGTAQAGGALIACGAFHSVIVLPPAVSSSEVDIAGVSLCYTFGLGENGQLGHGVAVSSWLPQPVQGLPKAEPVVAVACGLFHTSVELQNGDTWAWGMEGGLGLCPGIGISGGDALAPIQVFRKRTPFCDAADGRSDRPSRSSRQLVCGAAHTVSLDCKGLVMWAWGRGQHGALGNGQFADSWVPCQVLWPPSAPDDADELGAEPALVEPLPGSENRQVTSSAQVTDSRYAEALREMQALRSYANMLEQAIFGRGAPPGQQALDSSSSTKPFLDDASSAEPSAQRLLKDWEQTIEKLSDPELAQLEAFYRSMRSKVKDVALLRKTQTWCRLFLENSRKSENVQQHHVSQPGNMPYNPAGGSQQSYSHTESYTYTSQELNALSQKLRML